MAQQPTPSAQNQAPQEPPSHKLVWHKPTLTFVPLQMTANGSGTTNDANTSSTQE